MDAAINDEQIVAALRSARERLTPVRLVDMLEVLRGEPVTQAVFLKYFAQAFPAVPASALAEARTWKRLGGSLSDARFNELLAPFLLQG